MKSCLAIGGFDSSGGAGIQADLKTFSALGCYGMTILTALPNQNTCGVRKIYPVPMEAIKHQLEIIFEDIRPDAIKIGMLFNEDIIELVSVFLAKNARCIPIVLDPVMLAKSGAYLLVPQAISALKNKLIPMTTVLTPNVPEAYALAGDNLDFERLAKKLLTLGSQAVLLKGGHATGENSDDLFVAKDKVEWLKAKRINTKNTHGTGCTLSAAITALLANNVSCLEACKIAKDYLFKALIASKEASVGKGQGPVHHFHHWWPSQ